MLKILRASAGSGKTHALALEYLRLLLKEDNPDAYRHILAVTFTNKATEEMKRRILKELFILSKTPQESRLLARLEKLTGADETTLQKRAARALSLILHDYSAFSVSTIDRFFQQTLRAFSREIGQFSSYQVHLDREELVTQSVDLVLDSLQEGKTLDWLTEGAKADLAKTGRFSLEARLGKMAATLRDLPPEAPIPSRESLWELGKACGEVAKSFEMDVTGAVKAIRSCLESEGVSPGDTNRHWLSGTLDLYDGKSFPRPRDSFFTNAPDPDKWFPKSRQDLKTRLEGKLEAPLGKLLELYGPRYREYLTAVTISDQIYGLGVADTLREAFVRIQKEKNVISIDDSNTILHGIIDGTDAPFIYEKTGVRYDDFLLDEFQDTSDIQWDNFLPLLRNSEAQGGSSLVVGDVKQSIYRWRGSDWNLLGSRIEQQFPGAVKDRLEGNWRTCRTIVEFNNRFFEEAATALGTDIYRDVRQLVMTKETSPGFVSIRFTDSQMEELLDTIRDLREKGVREDAIAILVRGNREGSDIASVLVENGIRVVSDDSLFVKSSVTVRRLVSELSLVNSREENAVSGFLAREMGMTVPDSFHSLTDLAEELLRAIREYDPDCFNAEIPYIQAFMDWLQDWTKNGGNNLPAFLKAWEEAKPKISSPSAPDAVRIMTIHKAKGLEFPFVIFPFADKVTLYKAAEKWCAPELDGSSLEGKAEGLYNVSLDSSAGESLFSANYLEEQRLQAVDNLNIFYVAMTRPMYGIKIIAAAPPKALKDAISHGREYDWKNMSQLLYAFVGKEEYDEGGFFLPGDKEEKGTLLDVSGYPSWAAFSDGRLGISPEAGDYFSPDGDFGIQASPRRRGSVLHDILSCIRVPSDVESAVENAVRSGSLPVSLKDETLELLRSRTASVEERGWFSPGAKVMNEASILDTGGREWRPDRVVLHPDGRVDVIDYKFGEEDRKYITQVSRYVNLYRRMGYGDVKGYIWYVPSGRITECGQDSGK